MNISFGTVLGVDIGSAMLRVVELRFAFRSFELIRYEESSLLTSEEGMPLISETLKKYLPAKKLSRKKVIVSLPGTKIAFRIISFPFVEKKKIDSVIKFEVENLLPFDSEETVVDYIILGREGKTASVLCAVAEKREVEGVMGHIKEAGIDPEAVDVDLLGFANTVIANFEGKKSLFMAVNIDSSSSSILVFERGELRCVKAVDIGYEELVTGDSSGNSHERQNICLNAGRVEEMVIDLKRVSRYMEDGGLNKIDEVYWCGKSMPGFSERVSKGLDANVTHWNPLDLRGLKRGLRIMGDARSSAVALGLSLRGSRRQFSGVDFKKSLYPGANLLHGLSGHLKTSMALSSLFLLLISASTYIKQMTFQGQFNELRAEGRRVFKETLPEVKRVVNEVAQLKERIGILKRESKIIGSVEGGGDSPLTHLRDISLNFPGRGMGEIYRYAFGKEDIRIEGLATSLKGVDQIKRGLGRIKGFKRVQVNNTKLSSDKKSVNFKITLTFKGERG